MSPSDGQDVVLQHMKSAVSREERRRRITNGKEKSESRMKDKKGRKEREEKGIRKQVINE